MKDEDGREMSYGDALVSISLRREREREGGEGEGGREKGGREGERGGGGERER